VKKFRKLFEDGGLAQNTLLDKKKKPMSTATAEISFQSVKEVAEIGDEPSSKEASPNIVKKGGKTMIIKTLDQMREAKEKTEYDYEGDMARGQLQSIISNAQRVHDMLEDEDNLPEWVQSKITLAEDYISTVANYMMSEVDEEVKVESFKPGDFVKDAVHGHTHRVHKVEGNNLVVNKHQGKDSYGTFTNLHKTKARKVAKPTNEEIELDEVSTKGYHSAAIKSRMSAAVKVMSSMGKDKEAKTKLDARNAGLKRLSDRTSAEMKKANSGPQKSTPSKTPTEAERRGYGQGRYMGDSVEVGGNHMKEVIVTEMDKSQTPPGRDGGQGDAFKKEYAAKIITPKKVVKDGQNLLNKILKPKEKIKEAFRPMDEPNYNNSIEARQKKADDDNKPPFDGPYKKSTGVVTDKSGAKHGGMSIARNLAKQAMKKQASKMSVKEGLEESRKAEIVKEIMKKGKKKEDNTFQAEPEITTTVVKADN